MTLLWIFALGFWHGLHPDHAAAAAALALRSRTSAIACALRIALGHALALALMALAVRLFPARLLDRAEAFSAPLGGLALAAVGVALIASALHRHPPPGLESKRSGATALGLTLGLAGARSLLVLLPAIAGRAQAAWSIALFVIGIAAGCALSSSVVDLARRFATGATRWVHLAGGAAAVVSGAWMAWR